jgi:hypothetical protein
MHSPTLANDFSFRLTLAFAPFQPLLSRGARCLPSKSRVVRLLRTLFLSWRSFRRSPRLFSIACGLFLQNTGGVGYLCDISAPSAPARSSGGPLRYHLPFLSPLYFHQLTNPSSSRIDLQHLCFHSFTNPFFRNLFVFTSIQNPGVWDPNYG